MLDYQVVDPLEARIGHGPVLSLDTLEPLVKFVLLLELLRDDVVEGTYPCKLTVDLLMVELLVTFVVLAKEWQDHSGKCGSIWESIRLDL